jgi:hypothetical protein
MPRAILGTLVIVTVSYVLAAMQHYTDINPTSGCAGIVRKFRVLTRTSEIVMMGKRNDRMIRGTETALKSINASLVLPVMQM